MPGAEIENDFIVKEIEKFTKKILIIGDNQDLKNRG